MNAKVIDDRCIGCGQCEAVCEEVFKLGDEGIATVINDDIDKNLFDNVKMAASGCPTDAIEIEETKEEAKEESEEDIEEETKEEAKEETEEEIEEEK